MKAGSQLGPQRGDGSRCGLPSQARHTLLSLEIVRRQQENHEIAITIFVVFRNIAAYLWCGFCFEKSLAGCELLRLHLACTVFRDEQAAP
jgi:hypothetical protein